MSKAFVIGNGVSRQDVDVTQLKTHGKIYGCNALYRDFAPDILVATDQGISREIEKTGYSQNRTFYTRRPDIEKGSLEIPKQWRGWSSGPVSLALALDHGHRIIYLIGHDFGSADKIFNNVYAGTDNYRAVGSSPTYAGNWVNQITTLLDTYKKSKIIRVVGKSSAIVPKLFEIDNYSEVNIETFLASINTSRT
jgi:hypothetical protein